ncbi:MAG: type II toxin-antitoxin system HipA family toxin [Acidimicrobiales bacterium]
MAFRSADLIEVWAWGRLVGATVQDPQSGFYVFEYDEEWVRSGADLAPLHLPRQPGTFVFPDLAPATFLRLPALLADSLPDRFGNALVDAWMARQGVSREEITPLDRLAYLADRAMGALEFRPPADVEVADIAAVQLADLVAAARQAVSGDFGDDDAALDALRQLVQVGTSAGGARAKAVIAYNPNTKQIRSGQMAAPDGFEQWLVKLDGVSAADPTREDLEFGVGAGYGHVELAYHLMATAAGVEMEACQLLPEGPRTHFLTRRFDRGPGGVRHHVLSLCAMAHLDFNMGRTHGYEQYLATVDELGLGADARQQAFRRAVFNVAAVNRDDHTKNLAFVLPHDGAGWQLAPAYDLTHAHNPEDGKWTPSHQMSVGGRFDGISRTDLTDLADLFAVPDHRGVIRDVLDAVDRWEEFAAAADVTVEHRDRIRADMDRFRPT